MLVSVVRPFPIVSGILSGIRRMVLLGLLLGFAVGTHAFAGTQSAGWEWAKKAPGAGNSGSGMAVDGNGNTYSTGSFSGSITFDTLTLTAFNIGLFIAKHDSAGNLLWAKKFADMQGGASNAVAIDATGGIYLVGAYTAGASFGSITLANQGAYDAFLAKLFPSGDLQWIRRAGGTGTDQATGIVPDEQGFVLLTGTFEATAAFGSFSVVSAGGRDIFVAKYNNSGNAMWVSKAGGNQHDVSVAICSGPSNSAYICGQFMLNASFSSSTVTSNGGMDGFVAKIYGSGSFAWTAAFGGTEDDIAVAVKADDQGNVVVTGRFAEQADFGGTTLTSLGNYDAFLASYSGAGGLLWIKQIGGSDFETGTNLSLDSQNRIFLSGNYQAATIIGNIILASTGLEDIFIAGFSATGEPIWAQSAGGQANDYSAGLALDNKGNCYVSGICFGPSAFGAIGLSGPGIGSFVARLNNPFITGLTEAEARLYVAVYPNPVTKQVTLHFPWLQHQQVIISVYDATAKLVATQVYEYTPSRNNLLIMLPSHLQPGLFFLQIVSDQHRQTVHLLKQ